MAQALVDLHFNVQSLALIDSNLDTNVRRAIIRYADDLYLKHVQELCAMSNESFGGQEMLKIVETKQTKENPSSPQNTFRQVLLAKNRFSSILPRIIYDSIKTGFNAPDKKKRQSRGMVKPRAHKCPMCQRMFGTAWNMKRHIAIIHAKQEPKSDSS